MNIIGIDPGFDKVGYAIFEKSHTLANGYRFISSGLIKTSKKDAHLARLSQIGNELGSVIEQYYIQELAMEQLFFFKNAKTVIGVAQAQGTIMYMASQKHIPVVFLTPLEIKMAITGYGTADKQSVHKMLTLTLGQEIKVKEDDESDAIACALAHCLLKKDLSQ